MSSGDPLSRIDAALARIASIANGYSTGRSLIAQSIAGVERETARESPENIVIMYGSTCAFAKPALVSRDRMRALLVPRALIARPVFRPI